MYPNRYLPRRLPEGLEDLLPLAIDLRWSWNHQADSLWETVDPVLWEATGNPWLILESVSQKRLEALAADADFRRRLAEQRQRLEAYRRAETWFARAHREAGLCGVAYFSMEFGLTEALPIYSGGLGILAGDYLKSASDLGVPVVGVGLLYQRGYFHQVLDPEGRQLAFNPYNDPALLPVMPLRTPDEEWLRLEVELGERRVYLRAWEAQVGRTRLLLLDSNDPLNPPEHRGITSELYGGGPELRLQQEIVLGIGGWRLLRALGLRCEVCHLNEGHAALAVLERARSCMEDTGLGFREGLRCTRAGNLFTTHTPVEAAFDRFAPTLVRRYLGPYAGRLGLEPEELLALGRTEGAGPEEPFNMAYLAVRGSGRVNGVSRLHGQVSRRIFQPLFPRWPQREVPVTHVTNGVHVPSWDSSEADALWTAACGQERWLGELEALEAELRCLSDETLWSFRCAARRELLDSVQRRLGRWGEHNGGVRSRACARCLDPNVLTLGFARRFTAYKRPNLLLHDPDRLAALLTHPERPMQLLIAGKAHPRDEEGQAMIQAWARFLTRPDVCGRVVFLEDYDIALAAELVQGVDLWINTPRRPWEACGTSGMKVLVNGGLNLSELDGWWAEAYRPEVGWALGDGQEHDADPAWDAAEAAQLYRLLEEEVAPAFYDRDASGVPRRWIAKVRESMASLTPRFSTNRMLRQYTEEHYLPMAQAFREREARGGALAKELEAWEGRLREHWPRVHLGRPELSREGDCWELRLPVYLPGLHPEDVRVELYAEPLGEGEEPVREPMRREAALTGAVGGYLYVGRVPASRPAEHYTPRVVPHHPQAAVPLELPLILWQR
ncbi:MAG: glycosyltransferase family 1 protein [Gammaproteobacteria bacterium]|nr:MAG: glycosyltransferase family 1 protein [Gammaproteobacteria bacterium]